LNVLVDELVASGDTATMRWSHAMLANAITEIRLAQPFTNPMIIGPFFLFWTGNYFGY
jgi:hypothetical protein